MSLRYAQIFDGGVLDAPGAPGGPSGFPAVKEIHKFEATIPNGDLTSDTPIGKSIDLQKTWAIVHTRAEQKKADDTMVGYTFPNNSTIRLERWGGLGQITATVQLVEFEEGVRVQRGVFHSPQTWFDEEIPIAQVDLDKTFLTLKVAAKNDEFSGFDIVGEMWVRGRFKDNETVFLDHNPDTVGDSPEPVSVYWQVVEFADGVRVWSKDVTNIDLGTFKVDDILDEVGLDKPPRLDQTFMVWSNRFQPSSSGSSPRVDFWSMDGFLFNGTGGLWRGGGDVGEQKDLHVFIVELEFVYIESYSLSSSNVGVGQQVIEQNLGEIRDPANSVALVPWNQWGGFVDEGSPDSGKFWTTVEVTSGGKLRAIREDGSAQLVSMETYVIEFDDPPLTGSTGPLVIKNIYSGQEDFVENIFGQKAFQRIVTLPASVDQEKCIVWATAHGYDTWGDVTVWVDFVDDDNIKLHMPDTDQDLTSVTWYLLEFESGVRVQRGTFGASDFSDGHAARDIQTVDPTRAFVISQWGEVSPHGAAWLGGAAQIRGAVPSGGGNTVNATPVAWQVVEIDNDGEVHHFGKAWQSGGDFTDQLSLDPSWDPNSLFVWGIDFLAGAEGFTSFNVKPDQNLVEIARGANTGKTGLVAEVVDLGTFEILIPQREHHFLHLEVEQLGTTTVDINLNNVYDVDKTVVWVPMVGNFLVGINTGREYGGAVRLEMIDSTTLRAFASHRNGSFIDVGDIWEGYVYILGFVPEEDVPPPFRPPCPPEAPTFPPECESGVEVIERMDCDGVEVIERFPTPEDPLPGDEEC